MKNISILYLIILFLLQTGNVLSNNSIFNVNNIKIDSNLYENKEKFLSKTFQNAFDKLTKRILLRNDYANISKSSIEDIKNLILYYQIIEPSLSNDSKYVEANVFFDRKKVNKFLYEKDIKYSDFVSSEVIAFPLLIEKNNFFIFSENIFYSNWNDIKESNTNLDQIEYILPLESVEIIETIKKNKDNIQNIQLSDIFYQDNKKNKVFIVIDVSENKVNVLLKGMLSGKKVIKNLIYNKANQNMKDKEYKEITTLIKKEILENLKSQNIIDLKTPSFLNFNLEIKKNNDLMRVKKILSQIDFIENFDVNEMNKDYVKIKIKYYGKVNKISDKFKNSGLILEQKNNEWSLEII